MRPVFILSIVVLHASVPAFAAKPSTKSASVASTTRRTPIGKDLSWSTDIATHAERRVLELHAKRPEAREIYLLNPAPQAATILSLAELADVHQAPRVAQARWVLTLRDGRVIEHPGGLLLGGAGVEPLAVQDHEFEHRGAHLTQAEIGAWRMAQLRPLMPSANVLTGVEVYREGFPWMPISNIAHFEAFASDSYGGVRVRLHDVKGKQYEMTSLALADAAQPDRTVPVDLKDPRWWQGGAHLPEPWVRDDPSHAELKRQRSLRAILPTADRVVHLGHDGKERSTPLAFVDDKSFSIQPGDTWMVRCHGNNRSAKLILADAKGTRVELDPAAGWITPRAKP